MHHVANVTCCS